MIYDKRECAQSVDCPGEKTAAALKTKQTSGAVAQFRFLPFLLLRRPSSQWRYFVLIYCTIFWSYTAWVNVTTSQGTGPKK